MFGRENLKEEWADCLVYETLVYDAVNADEVMDKMEEHIVALESRIKELENTISNESKWIPIYYDLPEYGKTVRVRTINSNREVKEGTATFHDGGDWNKDYWSKHGDTVGRITHWMPMSDETKED